MPIINGRYVAPDPTPEQLENAKKWGYDPYDRLGSVTKKFPAWDLAPSEIQVAAAVIHDEQHLYPLNRTVLTRIDIEFEINTIILAEAVDGWDIRTVEILKANAFAGIVFAYSLMGFADTSGVDRNTDVTRVQGIAFMNEAKTWINGRAIKIGVKIPYPDVPVWVDEETLEK